MNGRRFRIAPVLVAFALTASACGGGGSKAKDATDSKSQGDWFGKLVDDSIDSEIRMRPNDFAADAFAAPLVAIAKKQAASHVDDPSAAALIKIVEKSDVVVAAVRKMQPADAVIVIGGVPSGTAPDGVVDASGAAVFKKAESAGGMDEWQLASGSANDQAGRLAVVGGNTWVFGTGPAVARMNEALAAGTPAAYAPEASGGGKDLFDVVIAGDGLEMMKTDPQLNLPPPITTNLKHVAIALDGGSSPGVHAKLTYADESAAGQADELLNAMVAKVPMLKLVGDLKIAHSGSDLTADLPVSATARDLVVASADAPPPPPDARPEEMKPKKKKKGH